MLGSAPIADVIEHSSAFLPPLVDVSGTVVDLGSGGGVPGLVIAWMRPDLHVVLVDRRATRTDHLRRLVHRLEVQDRVEVLTTDSAALPRLLGAPVDAVVARSFGPPEHLLLAALPILGPTGFIVVSTPPDADSKWTHDLLMAHDVVYVRATDRTIVVRRANDSR